MALLAHPRPVTRGYGYRQSQRLVLLLALISPGLAPHSSWAAEEVMLKYRGFSRTMPVSDLATLATTGEPSQSLGALLRQAGQSPQSLQSLLTRPLTADPILLDKALNSWPGEWLLDQLGTAVHPVAPEASRQALRSALVLSASPDRQITLLEVLQTYPTTTVVLEGDLIEPAYRQLAQFLQTLDRLLPFRF
ncbi:MAG: alpha/beta hydrolase [Cyanobacteriota bacterium]|nr:alpha/beta hydrolase [Cyanobacteriota bacterium]